MTIDGFEKLKEANTMLGIIFKVLSNHLYRTIDDRWKYPWNLRLHGRLSNSNSFNLCSNEEEKIHLITRYNIIACCPLISVTAPRSQPHRCFMREPVCCSCFFSCLLCSRRGTQSRKGREDKQTEEKVDEEAKEKEDDEKEWKQRLPFWRQTCISGGQKYSQDFEEEVDFLSINFLVERIKSAEWWCKVGFGWMKRNGRQASNDWTMR